MKDPILESLNTIRRLESPEVLNEAAVAAPAAAAGKGIGRFIPGVGAALGAYDAYGRAKQGDWAGAGLSALGGAASLIPGVGTAASIGIAGAQALRDKQRTGSYLPGDDEIAAAVAKDASAQPAQAAAATPPGADPKVLALQKQLIAKGAKITADGKMGPATQAAMKQFPGVAEAEQNKGNDMSESQKIAELRDRLAQLEQTQQVAEGPLDAIKAGAQGIGNFFKGAKAGAQGGTAASNVASGAANLGKAGDKGMAAAQAVKGAGNKVAGAVSNNRGKLGVAAGAGAMAALSGGGATKPTDPVKPPVKPAVTPTADPATASATSLTTDEEGEMGVLAQELGAHMGRVPDLDALLLQYEKLRPGAANAAP